MRWPYSIAGHALSRLRRSLVAPAIGRSVAFARAEKGAVAIEFAILALPFFTLIFAIIETSLVFFAGQILDSAVQEASRKIRTGQAQIASWDADDFREAVCDRLYELFDCDKVKVRVTVLDSFADTENDLALWNPIDPTCKITNKPEDCDWTITEDYDDGQANEIVLVQAHYKWPTLINLPGFDLATQAGNTRLLSAVRVFSNEPF